MQDNVALVLAVLSGPDRSGLEPLLAAPTVIVRVTAGGDDWRELGTSAVARLQAGLAREGAWGEPLRGEQQIGGLTWTVLLAHRASDGTVVDRVVTVTVDLTAAVTELHYVRLLYTPPTS